MALAYIGDVSLPLGGHELTFLTQVSCPHGRPAPGCVAGRQVRAVASPLAGGELYTSRLVFRQAQLAGVSAGYMNDAYATPSGSALTVTTIHTQAHSFGDILSVIQVSADTGRQLRVLFRETTSSGMSYQYFSADPTDRYLMFDAGSSSEAINGWIYHGQLVPLTPQDGDSVFYQSW
jgi:hypothetical protein